MTTPRILRLMRRSLAALIALTVALAGCGTAGSTAGSASIPGAEPIAIGQPATADHGTVTVYGYRQPVATHGGGPREHGYVWGAVDAEVCATDVAVLTSRYPFVLRYSDGLIVDHSSDGYDTFPTPEYPWVTEMIQPRNCVRGWIVYAVPADGRPAAVVYQPDGVRPSEWMVGEVAWPTSSTSPLPVPSSTST